MCVCVCVCACICLWVCMCVRWVTFLTHENMKKTQTCHSVSELNKITGKYPEILLIKFVQINRHWLQQQPSNNIKISSEPFERLPC